jgi:hypothetical protein
MKTILLLALLMFVNVVYASERNIVSLNPAEIKVIDSYIKSKEISRNKENVSLNCTENRDVRQYMQGDINKDGISDVVVVYGMEGPGNTWNLYIAVFKNPSMKFITDARVGGKGYRGAALQKIEDGIIELSVDLYSPYDALCCPSVKGTAYYSVGKSSLAEERLVVDCTGWKPPERPTK